MILKNLKSEYKSNKKYLSVDVLSSHLNVNQAWFSIPLEYSQRMTDDRYDSFLVGLLLTAMKNSEDIFINGVVSSKLLFNMNNYVIPLLKSYSPTSSIIKVKAESTTNMILEGTSVGTGFSGGVDSFCTFYDHYVEETNEDFKIDSLLFLNVGSNGSDLQKARKKFVSRFNNLKAFPDEIGLDFMPIDSNLHQFSTQGHKYSHTLTSSAGILLLQGYCNKYFYGSAGMNYSDFLNNSSYYRDDAIAPYCDPILLPLLSTESLELISDGHQYTRVEKLHRIMDYEPITRFLNVCTRGEETHDNCSVCDKCARTIMTIKSSGHQNKFEDVFDIELYERKKEKEYLIKQVATKNTDSMAKYNVDYAKKQGVKLPNFAFAKVIYPIIKNTKRIVTKIKKMLFKFSKRKK